MTHLVRCSVLLFAMVVLFSAASYGTPPVAAANNCQVEELVLGMVFPGAESPVAPDSEDPRCRVAAQIGCPDQTQTMACASGIAMYANGTASTQCTIFRPSPAGVIDFVECLVAERVSSR